MVEASRFGGTCLNRGCIPSKMLVHTADVAQTVRHAGRFGISADWRGADWPAIRDPMHERAVAYRRAHGVDVFLGEAAFTGPKTLQVGGDVLHADRLVLVTGSRPHIPHSTFPGPEIAAQHLHARHDSGVKGDCNLP